METLARIVTRSESGDDGLIIGAMFKCEKDFFEHDTVYEIDSILDTIVIKKVGKAGINWGRSINDLLSTKGHCLFLSQEEMQELENRK